MKIKDNLIRDLEQIKISRSDKELTLEEKVNDAVLEYIRQYDDMIAYFEQQKDEDSNGSAI